MPSSQMGQHRASDQKDQTFDSSPPRLRWGRSAAWWSHPASSEGLVPSSEVALEDRGAGTIAGMARGRRIGRWGLGHQACRHAIRTPALYSRSQSRMNRAL